MMNDSLRTLTGLALSLVVSYVSAQTYTATALGTLGGNSQPNGINNSGQVTGWSATPDNNTHAVIWNGTTPTDLGTLPNSPNSQSYGNAINNAGQMVGWAGNPGHATLWSGTTPTDLGTLPGGQDSYAAGINNAGQVVGYSDDTGIVAHIATLWNGTTPTSLGMLPGASYSEADGINNSGQVVGSSTASNYATTAVIWNGASPTPLGPANSSARAINSAGQVVGTAYDSISLADHATLWNGTTPTDLGTLPGYDSYAIGINNAGQVVGLQESKTGGGHLAMLWTGGQAIDLNTVLVSGALPAGVTLVDATGINDNGWIIADGSTGKSDSFAFLLTPVPLPVAGWLLPSALAALGWVRRRAGEIVMTGAGGFGILPVQLPHRNQST